jgi:threonine dehydrogenase-like Zn-dependent dehydrogenase
MYADVPKGGSLLVLVLGLGSVGDMACRIAYHHGIDTAIGVDLVPERLQRAKERGVTTSVSRIMMTTWAMSSGISRMDVCRTP